jgi:hypothetical protein
MGIRREKGRLLLEAIECARREALKLTEDATTDTLFRRIALRISARTGSDTDGLLGADRRH